MKTRYTVLPGGARVTLEGYLPDRTCRSCNRCWPAAEYIKRIQFRHSVRYLVFGKRCQHCDPPTEVFIELRGVHCSDTYVDDAGVRVGWYQRNREGIFGPELSLESLTWRRTADGIWRPQPKLDRRKGDQHVATKHGPASGRANSRRHLHPTLY